MGVDVHVVAGFLGAGKTTVLQHLLKGLTGERVGLIVNDFGTAAIDQAVLGEGTVRGIRGSCVCCTAPEGFVGTVGELLGSVDRILVEPTGLARPADVIDTLRRAPFAAELTLGPLIVIVDPAALSHGDIPADVLAQAAAADVLVANRVDRASDDELAAFRAWAAGLWPGPHAVFETTFGQVPMSVLAGSEARHGHGSSGHEHDHDFAVRTFVWDADVVFNRARLLAALEALEAVRVKGLVRTDEGTSLVQIANGELTEVPSGRRSDSRIDVIVTRPAEPALAQAEAALEAARLRPDELARRGTALEVALPGGDTRTFDRLTLAALPDGVADVSTLIPARSGSAARLSAVLAAVGAPSEGQAVVVAADGYVTEPVDLADLQAAVLLHSLGLEPLPGNKGGPFRLLIPDDAGPGGPCANVKAVVRIAIRAPTS